MSSLDRLIRLFRYLKPYRVRLGAAFLCSGLVAAFSGLEPMKRAYAHAIEAGYRFYSYGDACLLLRG